MRRLTLSLFALFLVPLPALAQSDIEVVKVKDHLYMLINPMGGNVAVSTGEDGTFIIDDQLKDRSEIVDKAIHELSDQDIKFIVNTHYHFDHTGGNEHFGTQNAIIVAQDNVRKRLSTEQFITYFKRKMEPLSKEGLPVVTFNHDVTFHFNGDSIEIIHMPAAHTDGDSIAYFKDQNVIVTGDIVFHQRYPFIDVEHGGSVKGLLAAVGEMLKMGDEKTVFVPGHGPLMNKSQLQDYKSALETISGRIEKSIKEGKTVEQILAEKPSQEFDEALGHDIVKPEDLVKILYDDLSKAH